MSSGDFAAELQQSVQDHIALVHAAAKAAKARIGQSIPSASAQPAQPSAFVEQPAHADADFPRPAVNFFADEPVFNEAPSGEDAAFESALGAPADPLPGGAISFDDGFASNVDDEGIPVWEDPP